MTPLSSHERFKRMFAHKEADRIPIIDGPWGSTIEHWQQQGMPVDVDFVDYFDIDKTAMIGIDISPQYPVKVIEDTEQYTIVTSAYGVTMRNWKHAGSVPEFLDFTIVDPASWQEAKVRMTPDEARIPWDYLKQNFSKWRDEGRWISGNLWFGFDITHSWTVGTERVLEALIDDPDWLEDMFDHFLAVNLKLMDRVWEEGYHFDEVFWCDDMGYKGHTFFSPAMYRRLLKPYHKKAVDWAHDHGIVARLHSCGDVRTLIPDLIEIGMDGLNPIEVKAGMDPVLIKQQYGDVLTLHGGLNAAIWGDRDRFEAEMKKVLPVVKQNGGYICSSDHSVPDSVTLEDFRAFVELAKKLGSYE